MGGSFYVNSPVTGNCEDFIVKDVIEYIDKNYRTIPKSESRGISGHSMGGFGALEYDTTSTGLNYINSSPVEFNLYQNYPNPFNPETVISYQIPYGGHVELKVYNILGEEMASLVNEHQRAGNHKVKFARDNLPSGIYISSR